MKNRKKEFIFFMLFLVFIAPAQAKNRMSKVFHWKGCNAPEFKSRFNDIPVNTALSCMQLQVPLIYDKDNVRPAKNNQENAHLFVTRLPAEEKKKGSIIFIPGGPGQPGINPEYYAGVLSRLRKHYDIISYDPRGVGLSTPRINCQPREENSTTTFLENCQQQTGKAVLPYLGTHEAINDLNQLRIALGEEKLTAVSYSYGTKVAAWYAERFPAHVRALVLDGVVDTSEDYFSQRMKQNRSYQQSFERFAVWCAINDTCPLPANPLKATVEIQKLLADMDRWQMRSSAGEIINADTIIAFMYEKLLWPDDWKELAEVISKLASRTVDKRVEELLRSGGDADETDAMTAINCLDSNLTLFDAKKWPGLLTYMQKSSKFDRYKVGQEENDICEGWPSNGLDKMRQPQVSAELPHLLFVAQRHDPTTPWLNALRMAALFRSPLLTREGDGHTLALSGVDSCVDQAVIDYLADPASVVADITCPVIE